VRQATQKRGLRPRRGADKLSARWTQWEAFRPPLVGDALTQTGDHRLPVKTPSPKNIVLIGMFGSGKTTVGRIIAQKLRYTLLDTDLLIERRYKKPLQKVLDDLGMKGFMTMEDKTLRSLTARRCVVAPGGSSVYYPKGMASLRKLGPVVYLKVDPDLLQLEEGFSRDVRSIGHYGTGDLELRIKDAVDFAKAQPLIQQSYSTG